MIYNLTQFLRNEFPTESFYVNQKYLILSQENIPDRIVILTEMSGVIQARTRWTERRCQVYCRDIDSVTARALSKKIYDYVGDRNGCTMPAVTVNGETFPAIIFGQALADQTPSHINTDQNGRAEFVFNLNIKYTEV